MSRCFLSFLMIASLLLSSSAGAQAPAPEENPKPYLVRDINPHTSTYNKPLELMEAGPVSYFFGSGGQGVFGLWKTDGTEAGTSFVKAIDFGRYYSTAYGTRSGMLGDYLFFGASELGDAAKEHGTELWRTDGTAQGTNLVADLVPGERSSMPNSFALMGGKLYFIGGWALWRLDGPDALPVHIWGEIADGEEVHILGRSPLFVLGDHLYFSTYQQDLGVEMWVSDGTSEGTRPLVDLNPGPTSSYAYPELVLNGRLYFTADAGGAGNELWSYAPASGETKIVADIHPSGGSYPETLQAVNDTIIFSAYEPETGRELYSLKDGVVQQVIDLTPGYASSALFVFGSMDTAAGERLLFQEDNRGDVAGLYLTDGTAGGTVRILELEYPYSPPMGEIKTTSGMFTPQPFQMKGFYKNGLFVYYTNEYGLELWQTDGSAQGTTLFKDIWPGPNHSNPHNFGMCGTRWCFSANDGDHGDELWATDGTPAGTALVADLNDDVPGSNPTALSAAKGLVYFLAQDGSNGIDGNSLWRTDGTEAGTMRLISGSPDEGIWIGSLITAGNRAYFTMADRAHGTELWYSDGTPDTTHMLEDIYPGQTGSNPDSLTVLGNALFFTAEHPKLGRELWITGGTPTGTRMVADITSGAASTNVLGIYPYKKQIILVNYSDDKSSYELWSTDGTTEGTNYIAVIPWPTNNFPFIEANGLLYFQTGVTEQVLWQTDGTAQGTKPVPAHACLNEGGDIRSLTEMNGALYYIYSARSGPSDPILPMALVRIQGAQTPPGCIWETTFHYSKVGVGYEAGPMVVHGGHLIFNVPDPDLQQHLMISDGTSAVPYAFPGPVDQLANLFPAGPYLYFRGSSPTEGEELWVLSDDMQSSSMVMDINPGADSSSPGKFAYSGDLLFFSADDGKHGEELWAYSVPAKRLILPLIGR